VTTDYSYSLLGRIERELFMALGFVRDVSKGAVDFAKDKGGKAIGKAKDVGESAVDKGKEAAGKAVNKAGDLGSDAVSFSREALEWKQKQEKNFANGVLKWGKDTVGTVVDIVSNPVESVKAVDKLVSNPVLNPIHGTVRAVAQGKNPIEAYGEGANDLKELGTSLFNDYKETYQEHGVAGLAGSIAPDAAIALATGGSGTAVRAAGTVGAKAAAKDLAKVAAKDVVKEVVPGPEDVINEERKLEEDKPNFLQALIENFS
jgi:hypothetical protein